MKKLIGLILFFGLVAFGLNFNGHQSLNGVGASNLTTLFKAPATDYYFVNGQLTLPAGSQVVAVVSAAGSTIYTGVTGATGFQIGHISLATGDAVTVQLNSSAAVDTGVGSNAVRGEVYFGNGL